MIGAAERAGLKPVEEVFADRGYMPDGSLVPRSQPGALIDDEEASLAQTLSLVRDHQVRAIDGSAGGGECADGLPARRRRRMRWPSRAASASGWPTKASRSQPT